MKIEAKLKHHRNNRRPSRCALEITPSLQDLQLPANMAALAKAAEALKEIGWCCISSGVKVEVGNCGSRPFIKRITIGNIPLKTNKGRGLKRA